MNNNQSDKNKKGSKLIFIIIASVIALYFVGKAIGEAYYYKSHDSFNDSSEHHRLPLTR